MTWELEASGGEILFEDMGAIFSGPDKNPMQHLIPASDLCGALHS